MGNLASCGLTLPVPFSSSNVVKLVHSNGLVEEFYRSVRVGELTVDYPNHVICHSHDLLSAGYGDPSANSPVPFLSDDDDMEIGQIYFLLPRKFFDSPLTSAYIASLYAKAAVAKKTTYKRLHATIRQLAPLPFPSMMSDERFHESSPLPSPVPKADAPKTAQIMSSSPGHGNAQEDDEKVALSKEFVRKLLAETRLKLQSAPNISIPVPKNGGLSKELETAYSRHILARSYDRLWRPPLDTIVEENSSTVA